MNAPLGSGIVTTALDQGLPCDADLVEAVTTIMVTLNQGASRAMLEVGVHAATDVTGFGLLGHLHDLALGSGVSAVVEVDQVPILPGVLQLAEAGAVSNGTRNNLRFLQEHVSWGLDISHSQRIALSDAQTSGGLLIAVPPDRAGALAAKLTAYGCLSCQIIGPLEADNHGTIFIRNGM